MVNLSTTAINPVFMNFNNTRLGEQSILFSIGRVGYILNHISAFEFIRENIDQFFPKEFDYFEKMAKLILFSWDPCELA
jgi:hypothetical protein